MPPPNSPAAAPFPTTTDPAWHQAAGNRAHLDNPHPPRPPPPLNTTQQENPYHDHHPASRTRHPHPAQTRTLADQAGKIRSDLGDLTDMVASRKVVGVLEPSSSSDRIRNGSDDTLAELLVVVRPSSYGRRVGPAAVTEGPDTRLPLILLAQVAAAYEAG